MLRGFPVWLIGLVLLAAPVAAGAGQEGPAPAPETTEIAAARRHFRAATEAYRHGRFDQAITEFKAAYEAKPHPAILFNLGQSYEKAKDPANALKSYREYLRQQPTVRDHAAVEATVHNLEKQIRPAAVQELLIRSAPGGASVRLDGEPLGMTPLRRAVMPALHLLELSLPGYESSRREVETSPEHPTDVDVLLRPQHPAPEGWLGLGIFRAEPGRQRLWAWVAVGASAGALAAGAVSGLLSQADAQRLVAAPTPLSKAQADAYYNRARAEATAANICYGAGAAVLAAGGALFFLEGRF